MSEQIHILELLGTIQEVVKNYGAKEIADALKKKPQTIYAEVDPNKTNKCAKLGLIDTVTIMKKSGDYAPLAILADICGFYLLPKKTQPDGKNFQDECLQAVQAVVKLAEKANEGSIAGHEVTIHIQQAIKELLEVGEAFKDPSIYGGNNS